MAVSRLKQSTNQKRIAQAAGVSQSTVSLVLSGRTVTSEQTKRRVLAAAERLKYRPNLLVHGMQTGTTRTVGVMVPPFDFFWAEVLYGIHDVLCAADHVPLTLWTAHEGLGPRGRQAPPRTTDLEQIHRLLDRRVDGVILWPLFAPLYGQHVREFRDRDLPVVTIDYRLPDNVAADSVGSDEGAGGRMVAGHLYALGHRRFGHLAAPATATWAVERRRAFEGAVAALPGATCVTVEAPSGGVARGYEQAAGLLDHRQRPTAVFAATDLYAKLVYRAAASRGLSIPHDLSVVGFADDDFAAEMNPPLTTVRQGGYEIGRRAAELLLARVTGDAHARPPVDDRLPVALVPRDSTAPPR